MMIGVRLASGCCKFCDFFSKILQLTAVKYEKILRFSAIEEISRIYYTIVLQWITRNTHHCVDILANAENIQLKYGFDNSKSLSYQYITVKISYYPKKSVIIDLRNDEIYLKYVLELRIRYILK